MSFPARPLSAFALLLAVTLSGTICPTAGVAGQGKERTLILKDDFNPPTKIKALKAKGKAIKPGQKFLAGDDWFEGLTASIVNDTGKAILSVQYRRLVRQARRSSTRPALCPSTLLRGRPVPVQAVGGIPNEQAPHPAGRRGGHRPLAGGLQTHPVYSGRACVPCGP